MPKKLMVRVRPGVELTCASLPPASAFSRELLPTLERPAKAISGTEGAGNFAGSTADVRNFARTFIESSWKKLKARIAAGLPEPKSKTLNATGALRVRRLRSEARSAR